MSHKPFGNIDMVLVGHGLYTADVIAIMIWLKRIYGPDLEFDFVSIAPESNEDGLIIVSPRICHRNVLLLGVLQSFVTDPPTHLVKRTAVDFVRLLSLGQNRIVGIIDTEPDGFFWDHALEGGVDYKELSVYPIGLGTAYSISCRILPTAYSAELVPRYLEAGFLSGYPSLVSIVLSIREIIYKVLASSEDTFSAVRCRYLVSHFSENWEPDDQIQKWLDEYRAQLRGVFVAIKNAQALKPDLFKLVRPLPLTHATKRLMHSFLEMKAGEAKSLIMVVEPDRYVYLYVHDSFESFSLRRIFSDLGIDYAYMKHDLPGFGTHMYRVDIKYEEQILDALITALSVAH